MNIRLKEIRPWHIRMQEYNEARERIFAEEVQLERKKIVEKVTRIDKARERYRRRKALRQEIASATLYEGEDTRLYMRVKIAGEEVEGLLDSGATVTCLGKGCLELVEKIGLPIFPYRSVIMTADETPHAIVGRIRAKIKVKKSEEEVTFFLIPTLGKALYLGVDFMKKFKLVATIESLSLEEEEDKPKDPSQHCLRSEEKLRLDEVISMFPSFEVRGLGKTLLEEHSIDTAEAEPVKQRHYPVSPAVQQLMYSELDRMIAMGVIEQSQSPWNNPVTLVRKGAKNRLCLDARKLNALTVKDAYPLPNIEGLLSRLGDTHFISSVDLKDAFWQIPLEIKSREKTAFTVPGRPLYHFTVMPFGLCNAAQRLCRLMDKVIPGHLRERVFVYLDDLLIVSPDFRTHLELLAQVAKALTNAGLTINVAKSKFCFRELRYLGYIVGEGKLKPDPEKVSAILECDYPKTVRQVRRFTGMTGWYRRFIPDYATIAAPIFQTLKKSKTFAFGEEARVAFRKLKDALTQSPVLRHPDFAKPFFVQCDASDVGIGGVLFQKDEDGGEHPIAFMSQKLTPAQKNYSVTERECLAVVMAIKKFRPYIELMPFTVITDHSSLKWLMSNRELGGRLARWSLLLQGHNFGIEHRKGSQNVVPDTLSRLDLEELCEEFASLVDLDADEFKDDEYLDKIKTISDNGESLPDLMVKDGLIYKRTIPVTVDRPCEDYVWKLWVPSRLTTNTIAKAHEPTTAAHGGFHRTLKRLRELYYWPNMSAQVRDFIKRCEICKGAKPNYQNMQQPMGPEYKIDKPFQKIYVDFLGPYVRSKAGNSYIFIVLDHVTKFVLLKPMSKATSRNVIKFLTGEVFHKFGVPEIVMSDNGKQFVGKDFSNFLDVHGVIHYKTGLYSPQANASERVNQSILAAIRSYLDGDQREWDQNLSAIECALRSSVHSSIGMTPYFALFGTNMVTHGSVYRLAKQLSSMRDPEFNALPKATHLELVREEIRKNLEKSYKERSTKYNTRAREVKFYPGQEVFHRNHQLSDFGKNINAKLCQKYLKCRIVRAIGRSLYEIENLNGKPIGVYHARDLKQ